jgi:hypothetical protein
VGGAPPLDDATHPAPLDAGAPTAPPPPASPHRRRRLLALGLVTLLVAPFLIGVVSTRTPRWYPTHDLALFELKVRDVWSAHPPLTGLAGRFGELGPGQGSHPGPLVFYALAVPYALLGSSAWALQASTLLLQVAAAVAVVWLSWRRGGPGLALGVGAVTAVLAHAYGVEALGQPWLPYLPPLWFVAFVLAVWSVADGDLVGLPVAVVTGSLCVQTHVSYAGTVGAAGAVAVGAATWWLRSRRGDDRRRADRWAVVLAVAAGVLVWVPPVLEQLGPGRGNLGILVEHFRDPPEAIVGRGDGLELLLVLLNPWHIIDNATEIRGFPATGSVVPGIALLAAEGVAVVVAWRLRHHRLLRLHGLLLVLVVAAGVSVSRIIGVPHNYLTLWVWAISALLVFAIGWTVAAAANALGGSRSQLRGPASWAGAAALLIVTGAFSLDLGVDAARMPATDANLGDVVAGVLPGTVEHLREGDVPGGGGDGRYLVTWTDEVNAANLAQPSFGLFDELEREGFDVGVTHYNRVPFPHRAVGAGDVDAEIHFSTGADIRTWRARDDAVEVAYYDPRDAAERAEFDELARRLARDLRSAGHEDVADQVADVAPLFGAPGLTPLQRLSVGRLAGLGVPAAVFVAPPAA